MLNRPLRLRRGSLSLASSTALLALIAAAQPAYADCVADSTGTNVTCSGTSATYTNTAAGVALNSASGGTVTGPLTLGDSATVTNAGTINATSGSYALIVGNNSTITNTGTVTAPSVSTGTGGILLGNHSSVTNSGALTMASGYPNLTFGSGGTFTNTAAATSAVTGVVQYGLSLGADTSTFINQNTASGFSGAVVSSGNTVIDNAGLFTGTITQTAALGTVGITNEAAGTFSGSMNSGDVTTLLNSGTMTLTAGSVLGSLGLAGTSFANNGSLKLGSNSAPVIVSTYGSFAQGSTGTLVVPLVATTSATPTAGINFSQIHAIGTGGTATLGGNLNITPTAGFYPSGSTYNIIVADQGITGNFASVSGNNLAFVTFVPVGVVTIAGTQQAYQLVATRSSSYAAALAGIGTPNQLVIATALEPLIASATAAPSSDVARLVGQIDILSVPDAQTFLDDLNPIGFHAYAASLRDQSDLFQRTVALRMRDFHAENPQHGWWLQAMQQFKFGSVGAGRNSQAVTGIVGGYDWSGPNYVIGGSLAYSFDAIRNSARTLVGHTSGGLFGGYAGYALGPLKAQAQLSYLFGHLGATQTMALGTATRTATAKAPVHMLTATGTLGMDFKLSGIEIEPFAGISYHKGSVSSFTESGATAADLTVGSIKADRSDALFGATITRSEGKWRPYAKATYRSLIGTDKSTGVTAYLNGDPTTSFTVYDTAGTKHQLETDIGLNIVYDDEGNLFIGYQGTYRKDLKTHGIMAGLRVQF